MFCLQPAGVIPVGNLPRFGSRLASIAVGETELLASSEPYHSAKPTAAVRFGEPGSIAHDGYRGFGLIQSLQPGLSCWGGLITTDTAYETRFKSATKCAFDQKAHCSMFTKASDSVNKINSLIEFWRDGVIRAYGNPYAPLTPADPPPADARGSATSVDVDSRLLTIGFDAEWTENEAGTGRQIVSYQLALRVHGVDNLWLSVVYQIADCSPARYSLGRLLGHFLRFASKAGALGFPLPAFSERRKKTKGQNRYAKDSKRRELTITLAGHYAIVDVTTLFKGRELLRSLDTIRRSEVSVVRPIKLTLIDDQRHGLPATVYLRDSMMLAADGTSLASLGESLGLQKVNVSKGADKSRMDIFRRESPSAYVIYAAVDAIVTLEWVHQIMHFTAQHAPDGRSYVAPPTIGSHSADLTRRLISRARNFQSVEEFDSQWRGFVTVREQVAISFTGGLRTVKRLEPSPALALTESSWRAAFYGGRNECFGHGPQLPKRSDRFWDMDVRNAYVAAMALVQDIEWSLLPIVVPSGPLRMGNLNPGDYFIGMIKFKFPDDIAVPCIPVKDNAGRGLIFPIEGEVFATAPEICLALAMGADIHVISGHIHPVRSGHGSLRAPVAAFIKERSAARQKYGKGSVKETLWKLIGNSAYGKLAQGLRDKRNYSTRTDSVESVPPSIITCPPYAALVTALVRALVSAVIADLVAHEFTVLSVTTDGFLTDADPGALEQIEGYGFVKLFQTARAEVTGDQGSIWECKNAAKMMVMSRTRAGFGVGKVDGYDLPCAAAGYSKQEDDKESMAAGALLSEILAKKFCDRTRDFYIQNKRLPSPRDYVRKKADAQIHTTTRSVNWSYDFKRAPDPSTITMGDIQGSEYVSYSTKPHKTIFAFQSMRVDHDNARVILKTTDQMFDFLDRFDMRDTASHAGVRRASVELGGIRRTAAINVLRGIRSGVIQVSVKINGPNILPVLSRAFGVSLSNDDWKNAVRREPFKVLTAAMVAQLREAAEEIGVSNWVIWASLSDEAAYVSYSFGGGRVL